MVLSSVPEPALLAWAFLGMALLGWGAFWKDQRTHWVRIAGWLAFGLFWPFKAPEYFAAGDPFNAWFSLAAPLLTGYIAYHEYLSWKWDERPVGLTWLAGATFVAATTYFVLFEIDPVQTQIIYWTGVESAWLTNSLFGVDSIAHQTTNPATGGPMTNICLSEASIGAPGGSVTAGSYCTQSYPVYAVTIIFACTALQSIMIFVGAIAFTKASPKRKWKAYALTVPVIYVLNLFRNAGIVYGYRVKGWTMFGIDSFEFMHSYIAKTGAVAALILIALAVFRILPELHENILDVLSLPKRERADPPSPPPGSVTTDPS